MANIISYIREYGSFSLDELPFNEVDYAILTSLTYIKFNNIISKNKHKITLTKAADIFFSNITKKEINNNIISIKMSAKILTHIRNKTRYKDLLLYNYVVLRNNKTQFSAMCIDIDQFNTFIAFEGTDDLISGWREDFETSYMFPTKSQINAIKYVNTKVSILSNRKIILGGHSKGGNLAITAAMYANPIIKKRIEKIYSIDGLGLYHKQFNSKLYQKIDDKVKLIIPNYAIVGLILDHKEDYQVVESTRIDFLAHDILTWQVDKYSFKKARLSLYSKGIDKVFTKWFNKYSKEECIMFTDDLFSIFKRLEINSLIDLKHSVYNILKFVRETSNISSKSKIMIKEFFYEVFNYVKSYNNK